MKPEVKFELESTEIRDRTLLEPVLEKAYPLTPGNPCFVRLRRILLRLRSALAVNTCKFGEAEWRRLEYRNEMPTREGERINHFGIR